MAPPGTEDYGVEIRQQRDELVALRLGQESAVLRSVDGITWSTYAGVPPSFDWQGGTLDIASVPDALLLLGESFDSPPGFGNEMVIWRITPTETTQVVTRRAAVANAIVVDGLRVLISGRRWGKGPDGSTSTGDDEGWGWLIGSPDGGATWPEASSWTGGAGSCLGEMAITGDSLVALACVDDRGLEAERPHAMPAIWVTATQPERSTGTTPQPSPRSDAASPSPSGTAGS
jgi:hypothetical protein